uniref:MSP domain-containing protein n=1 Tax=Panagrolaimus superbus TaxID=310955 RepID=A0A914YVA1_9BILA
MEPKELKFAKAGGSLKVKLTNNTGERQAIKVKCSDNVLYRVNPVFAFIENGSSTEIEVIRQTGNPKADKIVIVHTPAQASDTDAAPLFKKSEAYPTFLLPLQVES